MNGDELAAIEARASAATDEWSSRDDVRESAADVPALSAVLRERDNTIAGVREVHARNYGFPTVNAMRIPGSKPVVFCQSCQVEYPCATIAALNPQETP